MTQVRTSLTRVLEANLRWLQRPEVSAALTSVTVESTGKTRRQYTLTTVAADHKGISTKDLGPADDALHSAWKKRMLRNNSQVAMPKAKWNDGVECVACGRAFSAYRRKHHCRRCGLTFCASCSNGKQWLRTSPGELEALRVCDSCSHAQNVVRVKFSHTGPLGLNFDWPAIESIDGA